MSVRNNPFARKASPSPAPAPSSGRPKSVVISGSISTPPSHSRNHSLATTLVTTLAQPNSSAPRQSHSRDSSRTGTFSPSFIKNEDLRRGSDVVKGLEGENDFSGKRYVWLKDPQVAFVKGWVVEELGGNRLLVQCDDGSQREVDAESVDKVNPAKFDKANDMAELTHLNEASVVHNLHMRYQSDLTYTYSGLFLVTVNPYCPLPIYTNEYINMYKGRTREDTKPHIYAMADQAFRKLVDEGENQSILVTGESGAGKTENTKKVIQYLAAVAHSESPTKNRSSHSNLSAQILRANPILEAFGNAQTVRNNNSSRFGKFIRIEFHRNGSIAGAFIDWYLLEKSRVVRINTNERNYHVFYQLLKGADRALKQEFLLDGLDVEDFAYTRDGNDTITGVSDADEWASLMASFDVMGFSAKEQTAILRTMAAVLHLGNISVVKESRSADQARLAADAKEVAARVCRLLGVPLEPFLQGLLHPKVKAGREWVEKVQTPEQVRTGIEALAKGIYERAFGDLVTRINRRLDRSSMGLDDSHFIGVLDIAGFEILERNSFEQLCINYTNEKLQQFFNHHMFVLEQEEYAREQIEWQFIDFGKDLQPTIDLIELSKPIGIFSCLDEDCVMPKATDRTFADKLNSLWDKKSQKYRRSRLGQGFVLTHYAAEVEYSTDGWLEKNKDALNDNVTRLLAASGDQHVAALFGDCADGEEDDGPRSRVKKGLFRTVAQRHKEQLSSLMAQLHSTHAHFVRCILPNHKKRPKMFDNVLVLDQLRCNGVLEGIRIARTGFPNRLPFAEFRQRYEVLCRDMPKGYYLEGQAAAGMMLDKLGLDRALYRVGLSKVFFRAGVLAELEEQRDALITDVMTRFQAVARGHAQRRMAFKRLYRAEATRVIQRNFHAYLDLCQNPWWQLLVKMKPLLGATLTATEVRRRDEQIRQLNDKMKAEAADRQRLEEERRNCQTEMHRVQQTLESERALALDKEEIFKRLQAREAELEDKLAGALEDQEGLEEQLDSLLAAKKRAEADVERSSAQLEQAAGLVARLEDEKAELAGRVADLEQALDEASRRQSERSEQEAALEAEVKVLQSQLAHKDAKARDLETRLLQTDQDAAVKLATAQKDLQSARVKNQQLAGENAEMHQQLSQLSQTSTDYEDLVREKEAALAVLRSDKDKYETERRGLDDQARTRAAELEKTTTRLREVQAEMVAMKTRQAQLQREADDAKKGLEARLSEDSAADQNRRALEQQLKDVKDELYKAQMDLSRERQSRDDVLLLGEHKFQTLQGEYEGLNEAKITIEKELYAQQDTLRRAKEARATAEKERDEAREEIRRLRAAKTQAEDARREAEEAGERAALKVARDREDSMRRDLDAARDRLLWLEGERTKLNHQVEDLNKLVLSSGEFGLRNDQAKERLERELHTVRSRLAASENDNRALLNKLQQKGLEAARSSSRASEVAQKQTTALRRDKEKAEEQNAQLRAQLNEAQLAKVALEKKVEKLTLNLEDLNHEVARGVQNSRNAEKASSTNVAQLAEAKRQAEAERTLRTQAQAELADVRRQMVRTREAENRPNDSSASPTRAGRQWSNASTPTRRVGHQQDVTRSDKTDKTADVLSFNNRQDLKAEVEELQNQLQLAQMQNRHLQSRLDRATTPAMDGAEDSPSACRRLQKLEKANSRLHDLLDDSSRKVSALEKALRSGEISLHDVQARSHEEILDVLNSQEESRRSLLYSHKDAVAELADVKDHLDEARHERAQLEVDLRDARSDLAEASRAREAEAQDRARLLQDVADGQMRLEAETSKLADVTTSLALYKSRADEYFGRLEQAEMAVLKASRAEQFARAQAREAEDRSADMMAERARADAAAEDLQRQHQRLEERLEDVSTDLEAAVQAKKRLQHELEDYRSQRANDVEDKEAGMEQTRRKYQQEFAALTKELDLAREEKLFQSADMARLREELDDLRAKWDDEVLNSSTWAKEKSRLEATLADVAASRDEAVAAHHDAQGKTVGLLSQVRALRTQLDAAAAERDALARERRGLDARLDEARQGLQALEAASESSPALKNQAGHDRTVLELKAALARQEDVAQAAVEKMRRAEALAQETHKDMAQEREASAALAQQKAALEKSLSEAQLRLIDLETKGYSPASQDIKFLHKRVQELEAQLEAREAERNKSQRSVRNVDRVVKDLQAQLERKDKQAAQAADDAARLRDKVAGLLKSIDELQASESSEQLRASRVERELREEREKALRLERELEGWKGLRVEKDGSRPGSSRGLDHVAVKGASVRVPARKSSIGRAPSLTKGFL